MTMTMTPARFVVATDWSAPGHVLGALRAFAILGRPPAPASLVVAVPQEPDDDDERRVHAVLKRLPVPLTGHVTVESFAEATSKPYEAFVVPMGDTGGVAVQVADWTARLALIDTTRRAGDINSGRKEDLRAALTSFSEAAPRKTPAPTAGPVWYGTYVGGGRMLATLRTGGRVYLPADNRATTPNVLQTGVFEPELHAYIRSHLPQGGVAVDVGANIGILTVALARAVGTSGRVYAAEPVPANLDYVRWNVETNWLMDVVTVIAAAASSQDGTTAMRVSEEWNSLGSITQDRIEFSPGHAAGGPRTIEVETVRLDGLLANEKQIDLIKVDVEGAEPLVFAGMEGLLSQGRVARVAFECMREHTGDLWPGFMSRLRELEEAGWTFGLPRLDGDVIQLPVAALDAGSFRCVVMERPGLRAPVVAHRI